MPIDRRLFLQRFAAGTATFALAGLESFASTPSGKKPNIVVILSDDVGYGDLSCYGATHVHTPAIDAMASAGLRFTNAHSDAATCTPSRYAMLTGSYAWRHDGVQILPGDAKLLIQSNQSTIASVLKSAGYTTGLVGKWHIGLGDGKIDWNGEIKPGPCEVGFDDAFFFAATADRVPSVYIHNHRVVNLDPSDPIHVSYENKIGNEPTGKEDPELLKMKLSEGHDGTIIDGISRIGFMTGGKAARWKDEEMAATFTGNAVEFIEKNQHKPFLLYFTPSDIHVPRAPAPEFAGKNECGVRCDVISQLDWSVGRILDTLKRLHLDENTLVLFTSDNGPVVNDGYDDGSDRKLDGHKPAGPFRGGKYTIFEGGTTLPFIVRWTGHVKPGISDALVSQLDILASFAALVHQPVPAGTAEDSINMLPAMLGKSPKGRESLVEEAQVMGIREGKWKLIDRSQRPGAHPRPASLDLSGGSLERSLKGQPSYPTAPLELYDIAADPGETKNVAAQYPEIVERLRRKLADVRTQGHS
ncbi:sulfatase-like hydrolase/transferase [Granulicella sibirica]|uniref:Steryl-sulfatase n=1 Tax=Granulicella sibirica TaxID=2479048 RepID=A0A4Q0T4L1_9BACT|nr:sulfatase-like hydrolase/transferase [Granulicella sibirica]RXH56939.1 Steryl-sulfatase precursor [Granulicella sibirica]